jgi:surface antigen
MKRILLIAITLLFVGSAVALFWTRSDFSITHPSRNIGDPLDTLDGVLVYYNGSVSHVLERNVAKDGYNLGLKYQCVEFVKRYYYEHLKHKMPDSYGHAKDFFKKSLKDGSVNTQRNLFQYSNPSSSKPKVKDLIVFDGNVYNPYGHVAVVSKVTEKEIEITQQNPGPNAPSRETFDLKFENGKWRVLAGDALGWLRK